MIGRAFTRTLFGLFKMNAFLTDIFMKSVSSTTLAKRMTGPANGFSFQWFQFSLNCRYNPFVEISSGTRFILFKTPNNFLVRVNYCLIAALASFVTERIFWSITAVKTIFMAIDTLTCKVRDVI